MNFQTPQNQSVDFFVVTSVHFVKGYSQRKDISPIIVINSFKQRILKYGKGASCVTQLSFVKTCNKCPKCCLKSACRRETSKFFERKIFWLDLSASPKVVQILREGYTLPFWTRPNLSRSPTVISYANPHRNLYLLEALHQLMNKNAVELVQNQRSLGFFNQLFSVPKPNNRWRPILDVSNQKQSEPIPQGAKIQDGETGNHQNLSPTRGVGYLNRFQGCLYFRFHVQGKTYHFITLQ